MKSQTVQEGAAQGTLQSTSTPQFVDNSDMSTLPFMEIREEFDKDGNEIKAEVMNMSKVVQNVRKEIQSKRGDEKSRNDLLDTLLQSIPDSSEMKSPQGNNDTNQSNPSIVKSKPSIDISARLDELIRLEEEDEKRKKINVKSSKSIQGSGWKKGFLSTPKTKAAKQQSIPSSNVAKAVEPSSNQSKRVQFHDSHEVKEIPRIGTRSIHSIQSPSFPTVMSQQLRAPTREPLDMGGLMQNLSNETSSSAGKSVSIGGIVERSQGIVQNEVSDGKGHPITIPMTTINNSTNSASTDTKKKLSRFAQQKLQDRVAY